MSLTPLIAEGKESDRKRGGAEASAVASGTQPPPSRAFSIACLLGSALALGLAPFAVPSSYSWIRHTISESGAQGVDGAWVAKLEFILFGLAVWELARRSAVQWGRWAMTFFTAFAVAMFAVAAFSHKPWDPTTPFDATEDLLHSIAATGMGFAIILGALARLSSRPPNALTARAWDLLIIVIGTLVPIGMLAWPQITGLLQRVMFATAYLWFGRETLTLGVESQRAVTRPGVPRIDNG